MFLNSRRMASLAALAAAFVVPRAAVSQVSTVEACSQGALTNCSTIQLTSTLGIGPGGTNLFQIAIDNLGSQTSPSLATSIYFLSFLTGQAAVAPGSEVDALATPTATGGATISDASDWSVFESGDAIFLSALGNNGIGGCAASAPIGGIGQMGQTCGPDQSILFSFFTPRAFDLSTITLADMEIVGVAAGNPIESCSDATHCVITPVTATPEPSTILLMLTGLAVVSGAHWRRRATIAPSERIASGV